MASYLDRIIKPSLNIIKNVIPGKKKPGEYLRVITDCLLPSRAIYPDIVLVMTTYCSLKCKNCNNLMPLYERPYHIPKEELISDIDSLFTHIDTCVKFSLIGGEPFCYPDLMAVLDHVISDRHIMYVDITTNGTIIPNEEIIEKLKNPKVIVEISDYGIGTQKVKELTELFIKNGIRYSTDKVVTWVCPGGTENRGKDRETLKREFGMCYSSRYCRTMLNGNMFLCSRGAHLYDLGFMDSTHDRFDIRKKRSKPEFKNELDAFMMSDYADACNYCDHAKKIIVKPGEQA